MGEYGDEVDCLGGDFSVKAKIDAIRVERTKRNFEEIRNVIEKKFLTNVEELLEIQKVAEKVHKMNQEELEKWKLGKAVERELCYEMEPYQWKLVKTPSGKMKAVWVDKRDDIGKWDAGLNMKFEKTPVSIHNERQAILDELNIENGFPELVRKHCRYSKEEYFERVNTKNLLLDKKYKKTIHNVLAEEIIIPTVSFKNDRKGGDWIDRR
jgi:dTDP-4-dehydrorhamnose 3,5-epimerase-like enzyme